VAEPEPLEGEPPYVSHSQLTTFIRCMKKWELKYVEKLPELPAFWSAGGSAVHKTTEVFDWKLYEQEGW
jgi:hypothetical protein